MDKFDIKYLFSAQNQDFIFTGNRQVSRWQMIVVDNEKITSLIKVYIQRLCPENNFKK